MKKIFISNNMQRVLQHQTKQFKELKEQQTLCDLRIEAKHNSLQGS